VRRLTLLIALLVMFDLAMFSAIVPLVPKLAATLGLSKFETGVLVGAYSVSVVLAAVPVGHLADRVGPKSVTLVGTLVMASATVLFALAGTFWVVLVARVLQGLGSAIAWSAGLAWLAARTPVEHRGRALGLANSSATIGMIAGPLLGGAVAAQFGVRETFLSVAVVCLGLTAWAAVEPGAAASATREGALRPAVRLAVADRLIVYSMLVIGLVSVVGGTLQVLMPLRLSDLGVSDSAIGWLYAAASILGAVAIYTTGRVGDRVGRLPLARVDIVLLGGATAVLLLQLSATVCAVMLVVIGPLLSILYGVGYPLAADGADRAGLGHGLVLGLINLLWGIGAVVGPVLGGALAGLAGDRVTFAALVLACIASAAAIGRGLAVPDAQRAA
jgi:MFS family permease